MIQRIYNSLSKAELIIGLLGILSAAVLFIPQDLITKKETVQLTDYPAIIFADQNQGGQSKVSWIDQEQHKWKCLLTPNSFSPYCSIQIQSYDKHGLGIDFSEYKSVKIWASYQGDGNYVRLYLRNRIATNYLYGDSSATKYNYIELPVDSLAEGMEVNFDDFDVAAWWVTQHKVPIEKAKTQFNDIVFIEFQTGSDVNSGEHIIQLQKLELTRLYFTNENLYRSVLSVWALAVVVILIIRMVRLNLALQQNELYQKELLSINKLLNLQNKKFEDLARTDPLTGALNRLGIRDALYSALKDWKSDQVPFSLIIIDIDHFKKFNDEHGHEVGDMILKAVASLFTDNIRKSDYFARWGGEEFILACPKTDLHSAAIMAELLRSKLENAVLNELKVTASFGVATLHTPDLDALFKAADQALYNAKSYGRNQVFFDKE